MKGWTMPVRRASFNGVSFDVLNVDDNFERSIIEHTYPYVNGADLEAMGLNPLTVSMNAVFFGEGYYTDFKKIIEKLAINKPAVLVHPIRGRLKNMLCIYAGFSHDAEFVDYVSVQLTFKEATPAKPILVLRPLFSLLDELLNDIDDFINDILDSFADMMEVVAFALNAKDRILSYWAAMVGIFDQLIDLLGADKKRYLISGAISKQTLKKQATQVLKHIAALIEQDFGLLSRQAEPKTYDTDKQTIEHNQSAVFSIKSRFDELLRQCNQILSIGESLIKGKVNSQPTPEQSFNRNQSGNQRVKFGKTDIREINTALTLLCAANLSRIAAEWIEQYGEQLIPSEIEYLNRQVRLQWLNALNQLRALQLEYQQSNDWQQAENGIYALAQGLAEKVRNLAYQFNATAIAAINRKPPLIIRPAGISGTIQQIAHHFYGDFSRAAELLRLNAHIRHPTRINKGDMLNTYAN
ncbi:DNA circularization protein [Caviibacterium pharyngocola]|uniref:Phage morphogenesis protein n=1 Tax=Caviibacterium pharyngocola TaxID=28159 RepID=A0A2M8RY05_9PAST|nr:DNA circularization N-terminal domain-containing protein [Caviibacterium pharyngocola]PJG83764.1 phage morphogenesis protein [Caviibacterium pharyngocola]